MLNFKSCFKSILSRLTDFMLCAFFVLHFKSLTSSKNFFWISYLLAVISYVPGLRCPYFCRKSFLDNFFLRKELTSRCISDNGVEIEL